MVGHGIKSRIFWIHGGRQFEQYQLFELIRWYYFEHFQYILLFWISLLSTMISYNKRYAGFSIAIIYWFLFIGNSLSLHDFFLSHYLYSFVSHSPFIDFDSLRLKDFAEYAYWLIVLSVFTPITLVDYLGSGKIGKTFFTVNYRMLALLSLFSILVDTINANLPRYLTFVPPFFLFLVENSVYLLEECGEIGVIGLVFIYMLKYCSNRRSVVG